MSQPWCWLSLPPPPPPPALRTTASHVFFTHHIDATSGPTDELAPVAKEYQPVQSENARTNIAAVIPELAQAGLASSATTGLSHAAQLNIETPEATSNSSTACLVGLPTEVHCMIFEYLWTPIVDIYITSPRLSPPKANATSPIFNVNRQLRAEATDSLKRNKCALHSSTDDVDFRNMVAVLEDLDSSSSNRFEENGDGNKTVQVHLHLNSRDAYFQTLAPGGFAEYIACLARLGLKAEYEYTFMDDDGHMRRGDSARLMIVSRLLRLIYTPGGQLHGPRYSSFDGAVAAAVRKMQFPY
jgi:hypothetical protein